MNTGGSWDSGPPDTWENGKGEISPKSRRPRDEILDPSLGPQGLGPSGPL